MSSTLPSNPSSRSPSPLPTSPTSPLAAFPPLPAPAARSRAPEIYGFAAWTATAFGYALFVAWASLPPAALDAAGWTWYPSREWAVLVPAWSVMLVLCTYAAYFALALIRTPSFDAPITMFDSRGHYPSAPALRPNSDDTDKEDPYAELLKPGALPAPYDIPTERVNRMLYLGTTALVPTNPRSQSH